MQRNCFLSMQCSALVHWYIGALVDWYIGALVHCTVGGRQGWEGYLVRGKAGRSHKVVMKMKTTIVTIIFQVGNMAVKKTVNI